MQEAAHDEEGHAEEQREETALAALLNVSQIFIFPIFSGRKIGNSIVSPKDSSLKLSTIFSQPGFDPGVQNSPASDGGCI
ncbi:MAG: hypothetical protein LUC24_06145 [Bacteroidales bacterium]|nr:hypothetical protein [Bacteroidales bacterium]